MEVAGAVAPVVLVAVVATVATALAAQAVAVGKPFTPQQIQAPA